MLTDLSFISKDAKWPPPSEKDRLATYEENRKLFEGQHDLVFKDWIRLLRDDQQATMRIILNWHKRLTTLWADLLLGEPPHISAGENESAEQQAVDRIIEGNNLMNVAYEVAIDVSRFGTGIFKVRYTPEDGAIIEAIPPSIWFPVVKPDNIKDVQAHVLAWDYGTTEPGLFGEKQIRYVNVEIHERGKITFQKWKLTDGELDKKLEESTQETGIDDFLVIPVHNLMTTDRTNGLNDYDDLDSIIQELEVRVSQISRILDKHADPNLAGPESALEIDKATGQYVFRGGGKYFPMAPGDQPPQYVVWDGQLDAAYKQIEVLMEQLYFLSETSPAAFGQLKSGLAESGSALRRLMMAPLAKVNRIRSNFDPALKEVIETAAELEKAQGFPGAVSLEDVPIKIEWQDGLPRDEQEVTNVEVNRYAAGLTSLDSSLRRLYGLDGDALQKEIDAINKERQSQEKQPEPPRVMLPRRDGVD
jgi:hypothetical protein